MVKIAVLLVGLCLAATVQAAPKKSPIRSQKVVLTWSEFKKLSPKARKSYIAKIRQIYVEYEQTMSRFIPVVENKIRIPQIFFENAEAGWNGLKCVIGGKDVDVVGDGKCPTRVSPCTGNGITDGFKCGKIFAETCIKRMPISNLSQRCSDESEKAGTKPDQATLDDAKRIHDTLCKDGNEAIDACQVLTAKLTKATAEAAPPTTPAPPTAPPTAPPAATGTTTGTTVTPPPAVDPETGRAPAPEDPNNPSVADAVQSTTNNRCYESPTVKTCTPGAITLNANHGEMNVFRCAKYDANQPNGYVVGAVKLEFRRFLMENKNNPIVKRGLESWGFKDRAPNPVDAAISDLAPNGELNFEFGYPFSNRPNVEALLVLYNTEAGLCDAIVKNRADSEKEERLAGARKNLTLEDLKKNTEWNQDRKSRFIQGCKDKKVPQTLATRLTFTGGTPPVTSRDTGFPMKVTTGTGQLLGFDIYTFRQGVIDFDVAIKKERTGKYTARRVNGEDDGGAPVYKDFDLEMQTVHRDEVNIARMPPIAAGTPADQIDDATCDSFREVTSSGANQGSGGAH